MAFKMNYKGFPKRKKKNAETTSVDYGDVNYSANSERTGFDGDPYSADMKFVDKEFYEGDGYVEGLPNKVFTHTDSRTGDVARKRVQANSVGLDGTPIYKKKK